MPLKETEKQVFCLLLKSETFLSKASESLFGNVQRESFIVGYGLSNEQGFQVTKNCSPQDEFLLHVWRTFQAYEDSGIPTVTTLRELGLIFYSLNNAHVLSEYLEAICKALPYLGTR